MIAAAAVAALILGAVVSWNALASADARRDIDAIPRSFTCDGVDVPQFPDEYVRLWFANVK